MYFNRRSRGHGRSRWHVVCNEGLEPTEWPPWGMNMKGLYHGGHERNHNETFKDKQDLG